MAATSTTTVGGGQITYYDKKFLDITTKMLKYTLFGQKRPIPMQEGKTISFFRWLALSASVSGNTLSEGQNPSATSVTGQDLSATLLEFGAFAQISSLMQKTHLDGKISSGISGIIDLLAEQGAIVIDTKTGMEMCAHAAQPLRADYAADTGATYSGTITTATSTTSMADTALETNTDYGDANDDLNQSLITFTGGAAMGQQRAVVDYVASGGVMTLSPALDVIIEVGDTFVVTSPDAIASGDKLTYSNIKRAVRLLKQNNAQRFGGNFIGLIDPEAAEGLMDDTDWKNVHTYKDQTTGIFEGEIGKLLGVRFIEHTNAIRFPIETRGTAGTAGGPGAAGANVTSTGNVACNFILGKNAYGVTTFTNQMGQLRTPPIIIKTSGKQDTSNALNMYGTAGWKIEFIPKGLQPLFAQQIWTYAA